MTGTIWLIGNKGMLGAELSLLLEKNGIPFTGTGREVDITDAAAVNAFAGKMAFSGPGWIVNCAAYTAVDKAEDDAEACRRLNAAGPAIIAACAKKNGLKFIHISTDYVFNGRLARPCREDDSADPLGVYGLTKRDGELAALENNPCTYIIRSAWLYGRYGKNFVTTMLRLMNEKDEVKVVNDQRGSPTWTHDLSLAILSFIRNDAPFGIYHFSGDGNISWFDLAGEIYLLGRQYGLIKKDCRVTACGSAEYAVRARRPAYSVLDKSKIIASLGIDIPFWKDSLRKFLKETPNAHS